LIEKVINFLIVSNYSKNTIYTYKRILTKFFKDGFNEQSFNSFMDYIKDLSPSSRFVYISALKVFLKVNGIENVLLPKIRLKTKLRDYKPLDLKAFLTMKYKNILHKAVVITLAYQGIRRQELLNLKWSDIDFENKKMSVLRKGGKYQDLPMHEEVVKVLKALKNSKYTDSERVFPISATTTWRIVKRYTGKYPHYLRGAFASNLAQKNLPATRMLLGHSKIETTMRYVRVDDKILRDVLSQI